MARRRRHAAMTEAIVPSPARTASDNDSRALANPLLNETITILGADGAAEFIAACFRVHAAGRR